MARKRMIDPSIWTDEGMAELEPRQQLLYIGLISNADDDGRIKGSPAAIALMLPTLYSTRDRRAIDDDLQNVLSCMTRLIRYEVDGRPYLAFLNYRQWQRIDKPTPSILPPPPEESPRNQPELQKSASDSGSDPGGFAEPSANDTGAFPINRIEGKGIEQNGKEGKLGSADAPSPPRKPSTKGSRLPDDFTVTDDMRDWAREEGASDMLIERETAKFRDYWPTVPGQKGLKLDWRLTWKNWIRRELERNPPSLIAHNGAHDPDAPIIAGPRGYTPDQMRRLSDQLKEQERRHETA